MSPLSRLLAILLLAVALAWAWARVRARRSARERLAEYERRRQAAAVRLIERFRRPDGFDYQALGEASTLWLSQRSSAMRCTREDDGPDEAEAKGGDA
jgi:hypothetical protein